jgi:hypothetical protein
MALVLGVALVVFGLVALVGVAGYLIDEHADSQDPIEEKTADNSARSIRL